MKRLMLTLVMLVALVSVLPVDANASVFVSPVANGFIWDGDFDLGLGLQIAPMDGVPDGSWDQNALKPFLIVERIQASNGVGPREVRSVLEFDLLSSVPVGSLIQSATLRLASHSAGSPLPQSIEVLGYTSSNLQVDLNDYDRTAHLQGFADLLSGGLYSTQTDVTAFVQSALAGNLNPGFRLQVSPAFDSLSQVFSSTRNFSEINPAPYLEINFSPPPNGTVPETTTLAIWSFLCLCVGGYCWIHRRPTA